MVLLALAECKPVCESDPHKYHPLAALVLTVAVTPVVVLILPDARFAVNESVLLFRANVNDGGTVADTTTWSLAITSIATVAVSVLSVNTTEYTPAPGLVTA